MFYWPHGWIEQLIRPGQVLLWCLICLFISKIVCSNNTIEHFTPVKWCLVVLAIPNMFYVYTIHSNFLCSTHYWSYGWMEQLSGPGQVHLWCLICLFLFKVVCSNNAIGTFYSCRMVSTCFIFIILIMFYMLFCICICYVYCFLRKLIQSSCCYGLEIVFDKSL